MNFFLKEELTESKDQLYLCLHVNHRVLNATSTLILGYLSVSPLHQGKMLKFSKWLNSHNIPQVPQVALVQVKP